MRVILIVMDSLGIGSLPDASSYGDEGANTISHITEKCGKLNIPNLESLGYGNITGNSDGVYAVSRPAGCFGRLAEASKGKDTTTGHWEIAGLETDVPFKTYPEGFPKEFMDAFHEAIGTETLGNYPASGTEIIEVLGDEHEATGKPIVYTSADSVFQIAANTDVIPLERLYQICEIARKMLVGKFACCRVIARPYEKVNGKRVRTPDRRDYSVDPPEKTVLDNIAESGQTVYAVGKIRDIFNGKGITTAVHTVSNMDGVDKTIEAINKDFKGLIFTNLVDFDAKFGHRRNPEGYGMAIEEFDKRIPDIIRAMNMDDVLMITADHGNDPTWTGTDHTREYIPLMIYTHGNAHGEDLGTRKTFADIGATIADLLDVKRPLHGKSMSGYIEVYPD